MSKKCSEQRLWDKEPSLRQAAGTVTICRPISPGDPMGEKMYNITGPGTAPNLSTQEMKIALWGPPDRLTLTLGKTDVWDRRISENPVFTLDRVKQAYAAGKTPPEDYYTGWAAYDFPCPKPVGQLILRCDDLESAPQPDATTSCEDGSTRVELRQGKAQGTLTYLPMMTGNIIAVRAEYEGLRNPVSVRLYRHQDTCTPGTIHPGGHAFAPQPNPKHDYLKDTNNGPIDPPASGTDGRFFWIRQVLPAEKTFPQGFEYVLAGLVTEAETVLDKIDGKTGLGTPPYLNPQQQQLFDSKSGSWGSLPNYDEIRAASGSAATATLPAQSSPCFTVLIAVVTSAEAVDPLAEARKMLEAATVTGFEGLRAENAAWYEKLYDRREEGRIFRGNAEFACAQIPEVFRSWRNQHHSSSCLTDPKKYEADTTYAWPSVDWANWHGIPCYNELFFTHAHVRNRSERLNYFYNLLDFWWPACRKNAREMFGLPGASIQIGYLPPIKPDTYCHNSSIWEFCMELPAQVLKLLWDCYDYGGSDQMLRTDVYLKMRDLAEFYRHYVILGDDGRYHIIPTVVGEYYQWCDSPEMKRTRDTTSALCMFKWQLTTAAAAAERLGVDEELRAGWKDVAARLAPYPLFETPDGKIFSDIPATPDIPETETYKKNPADNKNYNYYPGYYPCILADEVNRDSPPEEIAMMLRTARLVRGWLREAVPLLLGAVKIGGSLGDWNGWGDWDGSGRNITLSENSSLKEWLGMETEQDIFPESLLNSRSGRIYLFPDAGPDETIAFRGFQARGGFLVTAEMINGHTTFFRVCARRNETCRLMNPWPGKAVVVRDETDGAAVPHNVDTARGECLVFTARAGRTYSIGHWTICG